MGQISDLSDVINRQTGGSSGSPETFIVYKSSTMVSGATLNSTTNIGRMNSLFLFDGVPSSGIVPISPTICTNLTTGAIPITNPPSTQQKWLINFGALANNINGSALLYDRLVHMGGLSGTITTAQTINTPALTRYSGTSAVGNLILVEVLSTIGSTAVSATISYTNQNGTSGRTTDIIIIGGSTGSTAGACWMPVLQSGDTGVQSVQSITLNASTTQAGSIGVSIIRPLQYCYFGSVASNFTNNLTIGVPNYVEILPNACLSFLIMANRTVGATFMTFGFFTLNFINK